MLDPIVSLEIVYREVNKHRLAAMDQNPHGFRDLLGAAIPELKRQQAAAAKMLAALERVSAAWPYTSPKDDGFVDPTAQARMGNVRAAIAEARAAGIEVPK